MNYEYKTKPFEMQRRLFEETADAEFYGILWEQGCGKSKVAIDTAAYLYEQNKINGMLLVAPSGVERNWITDEIPKHLPNRIPFQEFLWKSSKARRQWFQSAFTAFLQQKELTIFCISYDGFMTDAGKKAVWKFLKSRNVLYVLDESDDIRTPKAKRSRSVVASGKYAKFRRILTGTPADKPFDLYTQLKFLDPSVWSRMGIRTFQVFKHHFAIWDTHTKMLGTRTQEFETLREYKNLMDLTDALKTLSSRLLKTDIHDLPNKLYTKRYFELTAKQREYYDKLKNELEIELEDGRIVDGTFALTWLLRLQQITCGYMVTDNEEEPVQLCDETNPRLEQTVALLNKVQHQTIVWCRFRYDINQLMLALGDRACRYDGLLSDDECENSKLQFNSGGKQFFVGNPAKGGRGLTLNAAKTTVYYSNSFRFRDRVQSEDRNHRVGQHGAAHGEHGFGVLYVDMQAVDTVDQHIIDNLRGKFDIAGKLTGDCLKQWI